MDNVELPLQEVGSWRAITYFGGSGTLDCAIDSQLLYRHQQKSPLPPAPPPPHPMIPIPDKTVGYNHTILVRVDTKNNKKERLHLHLSNDPIRICVGAFIPANQICGRNKEQRRGVGGGLGLLFLPLRPLLIREHRRARAQDKGATLRDHEIGAAKICFSASTAGDSHTAAPWLAWH